MSARESWPARDWPVVLWLVLATVVAIIHRQVPASTWLMVHLVLLGALTHAIMVWSSHFTQALMKPSPDIDPRSSQSVRLVMLFAGVSVVLVGIPTTWWPLVVAGAVAVTLAVGWHTIALWRRLRAALAGRFKITVHYYLCAAACLPVGAGLGTWLGFGLDDEWHGRVLVAHSMTNLLGWVGLTLVGTLITLWPTMLRARMDDRAESLARQALPVLVTSLVVVVAGALADARLVSAAGFLGYLAGLFWVGRALLAPARIRPPREFATWSVSAALVWLVVGLGWVGWSLASSGSWPAVADSYGWPVSILVAGFAAQLLLGALSYLLPTFLSTGPASLRPALESFRRAGLARILLVNVGLLICLLPVPSAVRVTCSVLVLVGLAWFLPIFVQALRARLSAPATAPTRLSREEAVRAVKESRRFTLPTGQIVGALGALAIAVSLGVAADPVAAGLATETARSAPGLHGGRSAADPGGAATVTPTGRTTRVRVEAKDMRFHPAQVSVPLGDNLVIDLVNTDASQVHDLVLTDGTSSGRLSPGESGLLEAGVITAPADGWCSVVGHRSMGMVFQVTVEGSPAQAPAPTDAAHPTQAAPGSPAPPGAAADLDFARVPDAGFRANDPVLPPLTDERVHKVTLRATEVELEVAPGVRQKRWTFGGAGVGPTLHGRVGDVFEVTLVNDGTIGHSIDFHAGALAPDRPMRTIAPGESLLYRFTATRAGIWMYHCSTVPLSAHIAAGMHGAVVIEPDDLPPVDHSYVLVQSEVYLGDQGAEVNMDKIAAERPDAVVFNGIANQYDHRPLTAKVGERVRIWALAAGPNRPLSLHVIGGQFDTAYHEGSYLLRHDAPDRQDGGSQALGLLPAQGGFVELVLPEAGRYPVVNHVMIDAERGAHGYIQVGAAD